jgi:hypothetical protein
MPRASESGRRWQLATAADLSEGTITHNYHGRCVHMPGSGTALGLCLKIWLRMTTDSEPPCSEDPASGPAGKEKHDLALLMNAVATALRAV